MQVQALEGLIYRQGVLQDSHPQAAANSRGEGGGSIISLRKVTS